jgi:hypothetical protein
MPGVRRGPEECVNICLERPRVIGQGAAELTAVLRAFDRGGEL